jgi:hypothetical protein
MLQRVIDAGVPARWLCADEVYGQDKRLRVWCEQAGLPHVLATRSNDTVATLDWRQRWVRADRHTLTRCALQLMTPGSWVRAPPPHRGERDTGTPGGR